jgi:hypothetical protein
VRDRKLKELETKAAKEREKLEIVIIFENNNSLHRNVYKG